MPAKFRIHPHLQDLAVPLSELNQYAKNPRKGDVERIRASLEENGQYKAVVVRKSSNTILAGNHTVKAAKALGWDELAVTYWDGSDEEAAKIVLVDNASSDAATYDDEALKELLSDLTDLVGSGYDEEKLRELNGLPSQKELGNSTLVERFGNPPFTVLDARQGAWQARKNAWKELGIESELGREGALIYDSPQTAYQNWYPVKNAAVTAAGRPLTDKEVLAQPEWREKLIPMIGGVGTSIFDPVLTELLYRWFSPSDGHVLDPWAGGSVRGLIAARLGRKYTGIELRPEQVEANRSQAPLSNGELPAVLAAAPGTHDREIPLPPPAPDFTPDFTPVDDVGGVWIKREDLWTRGGASGAKSRAMFTAAEGKAGIITAGSRNSAQIERGALVAKALGIPCRIHTGFGKPTAETNTAKQAGADVQGHRPGRLTVIKARFQSDLEEHQDWAVFPFGMDHPTYLEQVAEQCANVPAGVKRVVVPYGSGMTTAALVLGLAARKIPILAISVGQSSTAYLDKHAPNWRDVVTIEEHPAEYETPAETTSFRGIELDPIYEAKCIEYLQEGDLLWTVGIRSSAVKQQEPENETPLWIIGESSEQLEELPKEHYDMIIGCPPYYDLEKYSDDPRDLSAMGHEEFEAAMVENIRRAAECLREDSYAVFIVGAVRNSAGHLMDMRSLIVRAGAAAGLHLHNDAILVTSVGSVAVRAGRSFQATRVLSRTHQDVLVFLKGDRKRAAGRMSGLEVQASLAALEAVEVNDGSE